MDTIDGKTHCILQLVFAIRMHLAHANLLMTRLVIQMCGKETEYCHTTSS